MKKMKRSFVDELCKVLSDAIDGGHHGSDWHFQIVYLLPMVVDICCKYRGYKSGVDEKRVLIKSNGIIPSKTGLDMFTGKVYHRRCIQCGSYEEEDNPFDAPNHCSICADRAEEELKENNTKGLDSKSGQENHATNDK